MQSLRSARIRWSSNISYDKPTWTFLSTFTTEAHSHQGCDIHCLCYFAHWNSLGFLKDEVTKMLLQGAYSFPVKKISGVNRYDGVQLASNSPCEDRFIHGQIPSPWNDGKSWMAWAIFDGHAGWQTADLLEKRLLPQVQQSRSQVKPATGQKVGSEDMIQRAVTKAFMDLDSSIMDAAQQITQSDLPLSETIPKMVPAYAGSCALLSLYDSVASKLHVACTGDSRAVLGQKNPDGTWEAVPLSVDQTGSNVDEIARINQEHPGEEGIAKDGRILGKMVSRAFDDGRWKWPLELQKECEQKYCGPALRPGARTPPYLTAEPVVTTTTAVDLVGKWLDFKSSGTVDDKPSPTYPSFDFSQFKMEDKFEEKRTTVQDDNAAVHLMRNSLGGNHHEMIACRLAVPAPRSRDVRDDITVQVAFFNCPETVWMSRSKLLLT
ncbi:putative pyruvate dehydrogenase [Aureobasidium pullulans]|uniref:Putative pyruvate dehydrogenase n=1 Tax=Aureobasidium pullulans TaxID=5580 RepID=A0A4S8YM89_AURPU|nr:putative pyruvate dehydrogenase [Aureobasidium pullulans]THY11346.1 putative pyruvate dehydrogenase [Aureobasidium pullulans]